MHSTNYDKFFHELEPLHLGRASRFGSQRGPPRYNSNEDYEDLLFDDYGEDLAKSNLHTGVSVKYLQTHA